MKFNLREPSVATPLSPLCQKGAHRLVALALSMVLLGCGQKGPLTLPSAAGAASTPAAAK